MDNKNDLKSRIDGITCDDISVKNKKSGGSVDIFNIIRIIVLLVCAAVFCVSLTRIVDSFSAYGKGDEYYSNIKDSFDSLDKGGTDKLYIKDKPSALGKFENMLSGVSPDDEALPPSDEKLQEFLVFRNKLTIMKKTIPDLYGWITVEGTKMDYPLLQGGDNEFYVNHAANGEENYAGAIFADFRCNKPMHEDRNFVIYGHNIRTYGTMFSGIVNFFDKTYFDSHTTVKVYTFDGMYEYTIFSIYETNAYGDYTDRHFASDERYLEFCKNAEGLSANFREGIVFDKDTKLLTLSTCSNSLDKDLRYALIGVLTEAVTG